MGRSTVTRKESSRKAGLLVTWPPCEIPCLPGTQFERHLKRTNLSKSNPGWLVNACSAGSADHTSSPTRMLAFYRYFANTCVVSSLYREQPDENEAGWWGIPVAKVIGDCGEGGDGRGQVTVGELKERKGCCRPSRNSWRKLWRE